MVAWQHRENDCTLHEVVRAELMALELSPLHPCLVYKWWKTEALLFDGEGAGRAWEGLQLHRTDY